MICFRCKKDKPLNLFSKQQRDCKECKKIQYQLNKENIKLKQKEYYENNKEIISKKSKVLYENNPQLYSNRVKKYVENNPQKIKESNKKYYQKNKAKIKETTKEWIKKKYASDKEFRIQTKLNLQIIKYLRQHQNVNKLPKLLGYSVKDFINEIGSPKKGYDIEHKIPKSWFKEGTPISVIWDLRNLQILLSKENKSKGNRYYHPIKEDYRKEIKGFIKEKYLKIFSE